MAKIKIIFLTVCLLTGLSYRNPNSRNLNAENAQRIVSIAQEQLGVRERSGNNDGKQVEGYLRYVGFSKGNPWCAAFVSWVYDQAGFHEPRTAWSPALFPKSRLSKGISPGFVYGLYDLKKQRIVHCGIALSKSSDWVMGIEGNTNSNGSADGDGVYLKRRHRLTIHCVADWIPTKGGGDEN